MVAISPRETTGLSKSFTSPSLVIHWVNHNMPCLPFLSRKKSNARSNEEAVKRCTLSTLESIDKTFKRRKQAMKAETKSKSR